jgi:pimeloyl-ACP methyl ester carboxylesterase
MFGPLRSFEILRLKNGTGPSVICINGFLTKDDSEGDDWQKAISESPYANSPIHLVRWDSSSPKEIFSGVFSVEILRKGFKLAAASAIAGAGLGLAIAPPLGGGVGTAGGGAAAMAIRPVKCWYDAMAKTEKVADMLSYIFQCTNNDKGYVLMGHSLGARVIHYLLRDLLKHRTVLIKDVFLLGGAVGRTGWPRADEIVEGTIYNCFSQDDKVLQCLYKGATLFHDEPIGLGNVEPSGIATDLDARELADVRGHTEHKGKFSKILAQL